MNRTNYIKYRQLGLLNQIAYDYFYEKTKINLDYGIFEQIFNVFTMSTNIDWQLLWDYYDSKFNITLLLDKNNNIIKVY